MPKLCANAFTEYVEVQQPIESSDGAGGYATIWANLCHIWCKYDEKGGNESFSSGRLETSTTVEFMTHYRDDITTQDRLVLDGLYYNITRVENVERKDQWLRITATSGVAS